MPCVAELKILVMYCIVIIITMSSKENVNKTIEKSLPWAVI